jgi:hypothetical protein
MLPSLRVNPWHVSKPRFIQCLLGGRKAPHSKTLQKEIKEVEWKNLHSNQHETSSVLVIEQIVLVVR